MKILEAIDKYLKEEKKKDYTDDDWVLVYQRKPIDYFKNPKSDKAPMGKIKTSKYDELMRISKAKKMGIIKEAKSESTKMECMECGHKFKKKLGPKTVDVRCPKCKGYDTDVA